jgi:hypothetical protein
MWEIARPELLHTVFDIVLSGFIGSLVTIYFTRSHERTQVSLDIIREYRALYHDLGVALGLLKHPDLLSAVDNQNKVKAIGNWYDIVSTLWLAKEANERLLKTFGIHKSARNFREMAEKASRGQEWLRVAVEEKWKGLAAVARKGED